MNRCDFSSISTCLKNHISESNQMSQPDFLYELFEDFMDDPANQDFSMDDIVNIGLHFFLKNVRPYAASCSEA